MPTFVEELVWASARLHQASVGIVSITLRSLVSDFSNSFQSYSERFL